MVPWTVAPEGIGKEAIQLKKGLTTESPLRRGWLDPPFSEWSSKAIPQAWLRKADLAWTAQPLAHYTDTTIKSMTKSPLHPGRSHGQSHDNPSATADHVPVRSLRACLTQTSLREPEALTPKPG